MRRSDPSACAPSQRLMTPEALQFVAQTSFATVKGWEDRARLENFRWVCEAHPLRSAATEQPAA